MSSGEVEARTGDGVDQSKESGGVKSGADDQHRNSGGFSTRLHPLGWVALAVLVGAVLGSLVGTDFLIGNLLWWHWLVLVGTVLLSTSTAAMDVIRRFLERIPDFTGAIAWRLAWMVFFIQLFNVVTRYTNNWFERDILFGQSTSLAWMTFSLLFLLGVNYGVKAGVNPRIDFWWAEFKPQTKAWLDFVLHCLLFLPFLFMGARLLIRYAGVSLGQRRDGSWPEGWRVWETWEQATDADQLPVGPIQAFIFVGFCLWGLQILAEVIKNGFVMMGRADLADVEESDAPLRVE